jgi:uncharacterized lipoprotein
MFKNILLSFVMVVMVSSCGLTGNTSKQESDYVKEDIRINKLIIRNGLSKKITNVKLMIPDTDAFIKIEHMGMGQKAVINFNKNYRSQERVILTYGSQSNTEKFIVRLPPIEEKNYSGYDLQIDILKFGTAVSLK